MAIDIFNPEEAIIKLHDSLQKNQEALGIDFQKILDENLSELLVRW